MSIFSWKNVAYVILLLISAIYINYFVKLLNTTKIQNRKQQTRSIIYYNQIDYYGSNGAQHSRLQSEKIEQYKNNAILHSPIINTMSKSNSKWVISAKKGSIVGQKRFQLSGDVHIINLNNTGEKKISITTSNCTYLADKKLIFSTAKTIIKTKNSSISSDGVKINLTTDQIILNTNTKAYLSPGDLPKK